MSMFYELMMRKKGMPKNYELVDYIESTGTQYIDTGVKAKEGIEFICDVAFIDLVSGRFGSGTTTGYRYYFGVNNSYYIGANSTTYNHTIMSADTNKHSFKLNDNGLYIDDNLVYSSVASYPSEAQALNIFLFKSNTTVDFSAKCKNYSSMIKLNGRTIRNFIPVYDTLTQKYGMWETVQRKFYGNDGTGDFGGSIVGYTVVGSPTIDENGVASGFSENNYLQINNLDITKPFEINIKINSFNTTGSSQYIFGLQGTNSLGFYLGTSGKGIGGSYGNSYWIGVATNMTVGNPFIFNFKGNGVTLTATVIQDNITQTSSKTIEEIGLSGNYNIRLGRFGANQPFTSGFIDLPETYIKVNNKLWFNGQEA